MEGEKTAVRYLEDGGYRVMARNFVCPLGEIDVIVQKGGTIAFVEVKTRRSLTYGRPAEAVTGEKQAHIRRVAALYLQQEISHLAASGRVNFRFDIMEILCRNGQETVTYIENAFY
jgi:putative endonuclease